MMFVLAMVLQPAPGGVFIDADGAVQSRDVGERKHLDALRAAARKEKKAGDLVFVSLPRAIREPGAARHLGGMVRIRYIFVFPDDLVIAGPAEPIDETFPGRPVGKRTGRPVLQLEDLVVALRTTSPFGCSIEFADGAQDKMSAEYEKWKDVISKDAGRRREAYDEIAKAAGPQQVKFFGIESDTRFAFVCLEADYLLKRHSLGVDATPLKAAPSLLDLVTQRGSVSDRAWFEVSYEPLVVSKDGNAFELRGPSLQLKTREGAGPVSVKYAENITRHVAKMTEEIPAWADLANLADLALVAALIRADRLDRRAGWDLSALKEFPVTKVPVAKSVSTAINFRTASSFLVVVEGGVSFSLDEAVRARAEGEPSETAQKPGTGWSSTRSQK